MPDCPNHDAPTACDICHDCRDCCGCDRCPRCGSRASDPCPACARCNLCCRCFTCPGCLRRTTPACRTCGRCNLCCPCRTRGYVPRFASRGTHHVPGLGQLKENPIKRLVSAEIEIAGLSGPGGHAAAPVARWGGAVVDDGSLPEDGVEINTAPAGGDLWPEQIRAICAGLKSAGAFVEYEDEDDEIRRPCGLHVHADARDLSYWDVRRLMCVWIRVEAAVYRCVAPDRRSSRYCLPCAGHFGRALAGNAPGKGNKKFRGDFARALYGRTDTRERDRVGRGRRRGSPGRYWGLNLHSWLYRGTVEFRMHEGTINPDVIIPWGIACASVVDWAAKHGDADVDALPADAFAALLSLMPDKATRNFLRRAYRAPVVTPAALLEAEE